MRVAVVAFTTARKVYIKLYSINRTFLPAVGAERIALELEFFQLRLKSIEIHAKVHHRPKKHITTDAAENVEVEGLQGAQG